MTHSAEITIISLRFGRDRGRMPPLGALSLAGALAKAGHRWSIIDSQKIPEFNAFSSSELSKIMSETRTEYIGISLFNDAIPVLIAALDRIGPDLRSKIIVGGPGVVGIARPLMERLPSLHAVVVGEGESALLDIVSNFSITGGVVPPGVFVRRSDGKIVGDGQTRREKLSQLPAPAWDWCRNRDYDLVPLSTMRGCPFPCSFCEITAFMGRKVVRRGVETSLDELQYAIQAIGTDDVALLDDTFTIDPRHVSSFCHGVLDRNIDIRFSAFSRVDTLSEAHMALLRRAGCQRVFFGIDSGSNAMLDFMKKGTTIASALETVKLASHYFSVTASFIWGFPDETDGMFAETVACCRSLLNHDGEFPITPQLHLLSPSAGTEIYNRYGNDILLDLDVPSLLMSNGLSNWSDNQHYAEVLSIIETEPLLGAPFYRYPTQDFTHKAREVAKIDEEITTAIGSRVVRKLADLGVVS